MKIMDKTPVTIPHRFFTLAMLKNTLIIMDFLVMDFKLH